MVRITEERNEPYKESRAPDVKPHDIDLQRQPHLVLDPDMYRSGVVRMARLTDGDRVRLAAQRYIETLPNLAREIIMDIAHLQQKDADAWITDLVADQIDQWGHGTWIKPRP